MDVSYGYCQCGCNQKTNLILSTARTRGLIKGQPRRFINGHSGRRENNANWKGGKIISKERVLIFNPDHPYSTSDGYVCEARLIAEKVVGKLLPQTVIVHHIDKNSTKNENSNLVVCENQIYHMRLHRRLKALGACGYAHWRQCSFCHQYDDPTNMSFPPSQAERGYHLSCRAKYYRERKQRSNSHRWLME